MSARYLRPDAIVTTSGLADQLGDPALRVFDCTTYLRYETGTGRPYRIESGRADHEAAHIPGSAFLDLQGELSDRSSPFNFTMPAPEDLAAALGAKGIGDDARVVLYARGNLQWATRVWWMLRAIGFDRAAVLDGGYDSWAAEGRPTEAGRFDYPPARLTARPRPGLFVGKAEVAAAIGDPATCTINALAPDLHSGANDRYGRPGRIPGSVNVPVAALTTPALAFRPAEEVAAAFTAVGADPSRRTILYCGGGIAATLDAFLLHQLGHADVAVYDASMNEWAKDPALPMERG
ncbi:sulfurtransferase [Roseomonas sp. CECT 9278]|uniref:sulfurtransferase n=1 Tax=Roseomonas sp. CECT 9278 TaxID=2845823 RepID=UPI001E5FE140|nr:sulfurtransferase [Roseomonas sp. CECT 9278]CAH0154197.1 3-mercaptopyruvate sulfurtransferase [Roseomonas sp. CECT 9278]